MCEAVGEALLDQAAQGDAALLTPHPDAPGAADLANMFAYKHDFNGMFRALRSVAETRELHPGVQDFKTWLNRHAPRIPLAA